MPHTIQQSESSITNAFLFTFTQRHVVNNESGMLRFHTVEKYSLNAGAVFRWPSVCTSDGPGTRWYHGGSTYMYPGKRHAREIITKYFCIVPLSLSLFQYQASNIMNSHLKDAPVLSIYYQMRGGVVKAGEALTRTKTDVFTQGTAEELLDWNCCWNGVYCNCCWCILMMIWRGDERNQLIVCTQSCIEKPSYKFWNLIRVLLKSYYSH